jgi:hypothetical protein
MAIVVEGADVAGTSSSPHAAITVIATAMRIRMSRRRELEMIECPRGISGERRRNLPQAVL